MTNETLTRDPSATPIAPSSTIGLPAPQSPPSSALLEEAYDAYCKLQEAGLPIDESAFVRGYASIQSSLGRLLELHHLAEEENAREVAEIDWSKIGAWLRGNYDIECELGEGKFSRVYLATQPKLGHRRVALKVTWEGDGEAYTIGRLEHPNVVSAYGVETLADQGLSVICMPYQGSATLCSLLDRVLASHVPPPSAAVIFEAARDVHSRVSTPVPELAAKQSFERGVRCLFARICDALEALHGQGVLHRDLKPSNVLLRPNGSPVLLDFNLSRDAQAPSGRFGGTFPYMPPEQLRAMAGVTDALTQKLDPRSDLYSVGALLWEALTGTKPFGETRHTQSTVECVRELSARQQAGFAAPMPPGWSVSPELTSIVRRCLSVNPDERPRSAAELRRLLETPPERPHWRRTTTTVVVAALVAALGVAVVAARPAGIFRFDAAENGRKSAAARFYEEAIEAERAGDLNAARNALSRVLMESPKDALALRARGYLAARTASLSPDDARRALADLKSAHGIDKKDNDMAALGYLHHVSGNLPMAAFYYEKLRETKNRTPAIVNNLAAFHLSTNRHDEALKTLDDVVAQMRESQAPRINRGMGAFEKSVATSTPPQSAQKKAAFRESAIVDFTEALRLGPDSGELRFLLAQALAFPEPRVGWNIHLAAAVELGKDPSDFAMGTIWSSVRQTPEFQTILSLSPGDRKNFKLARLIPPNPEWPQ